MAIYSLNRRPILKGERPCRLRACRGNPGGPLPDCWRCAGTGRWTPNRPGFAAAHARYITRKGACGVLIARLPVFVPETPAGIASWLRAVERDSRKNSRIGERIMTAIPVELEERSERANLVRTFYDRLTDGGAAPYFAAIHDLEGDADNPHAHGFVVDRGVETGRRVVGFGNLFHGEEYTTEWIRREWETAVNEALAASGTYATVDRRSFARKGEWDRVPGRHRGPVLSLPPPASQAGPSAVV